MPGRPEFLVCRNEKNGDRFVKTIVISGEKSGVGKTYIAEQLLRYLSGAGCSDSLRHLFGVATSRLKICRIRRWSALKITVGKEGGCPRARSCGVCREMEKPFSIIKDQAIIDQPGKDTARLKEAGAREVIWLKAKPHGLKKGFSQALSAFDSCAGVIIEGTSVLKVLKPDVHIHVYNKGNYILCPPLSKMKPYDPMVRRVRDLIHKIPLT